MSLLGKFLGGGKDPKKSPKGGKKKSVRKSTSAKPGGSGKGSKRIAPKKPSIKPKAKPDADKEQVPNEAAASAAPASEQSAPAPKRGGSTHRMAKPVFRSISGRNRGSSVRRKRSSMKGKQLGALLVKREVISEDQLQKALTYQEENGGLLGQILIEMNYCRKSDIGAAINKQRTITTVVIENIKFDPEALALLDKDFCEKNKVIPFEKIGNFLCVAMSNVLDATAKNEMKDATQLQIKTFDADWREIQDSIETNYSGQASQKTSKEQDTEAQPDADDELVIELPDEEEVENIDLTEDLGLSLPSIEEEQAEAPAESNPRDTQVMNKQPVPEASSVDDLVTSEAGEMEQIHEMDEIAGIEEIEEIEEIPEIEEIDDIEEIEEIEDIDVVGGIEEIEELETAPAAPVAAAAPAPAQKTNSGPLSAIPVSEPFFKNTVNNGSADPAARWLAEKSGRMPIPAIPAPEARK